MSASPAPGPVAPRRAAPFALGGALLALAASVGLAAGGVDPFPTWEYVFAWYALLLALEAGLAWREGRWSLLERPRFALGLFLWSVPAWLFFELLNLRVANWYYVFGLPDVASRRVMAVLAFATVLPAIHLGHRWMASLRLAAGWRSPGFRVDRRLRGTLVVAGAVFLALALWRPAIFFPLIWGASTLLLEPWNHARDPSASLLGDLATGRPARTVRLLAAGAAIGLAWEILNAAAETRWVYTVPGLEELKLFEMPVPGYLGFPVFAVDCFVMWRALVNLGVAPAGWGGAGPARPGEATTRSPADGATSRSPARGVARRALAWGAAAVFSLLVLRGVDRWTLDSLRPGLPELPGVSRAEAAALRDGGIEGVGELSRRDPDEVVRRAGLPAPAAARAVESARLTALRGMGAENAAALMEAGIPSACALARATPEEVSAAVRRRRADPRAGHPARVRVWIRAAREGCPAEEEATRPPRR